MEWQTLYRKTVANKMIDLLSIDPEDTYIPVCVTGGNQLTAWELRFDEIPYETQLVQISTMITEKKKISDRS
jgi:hypothetical protein